MSSGMALPLTPNSSENNVVRTRLNATRLFVATALESLQWGQWSYLLNEECSLESVAEIETTKVQLHEWTTIFSQLFGVNGSAIPDDMQNHFEYSQNLYLQFLTSDLIVLNTMLKLVSFLHYYLQFKGSILDAKLYWSDN
jgi:hypothetical protein